MTTDTDTQTAPQTHPFQAEVAELLRLMVHSVYSETDIFLRELISNASDACDRLRYDAIAQPGLLADDTRLAIRIRSDAAAGTLTIADNGIGMDRQELIDNLGSVPRGTEVVLHLKPDAKRYLEPHEIERIVRTYSDHILFPIELVAAGAAGPDGAADEPRQINSASALWQRAKSELKPEDYKQAYRSIAGAFDDPAMTLHYRAEGRQSYAVLLFAPSRAPFDLFDPARKGHVKLYVRRVYITDDAGLLPSYLRFMRGVVDSADLPLNISREMLQNNPQVALMRKALTGRVVTEL